MTARKLYLELSMLFALLVAACLILAFTTSVEGILLLVLVGLAAIFAGLFLSSLVAMISPSPHQTMSDNIAAALISLIIR